jgi:hypothetical protein
VTTSDGSSTSAVAVETPKPDAAVTSDVCVYLPSFDGGANGTYMISVTAANYQPGHISNFAYSVDSCGQPTSQRSATVSLMPSD